MVRNRNLFSPRKESHPKLAFNWFLAGALQNAWSLNTAEFEKLATCSEILGEGNEQITSGFGRYLFFERVFASIFVLYKS